MEADHLAIFASQIILKKLSTNAISELIYEIWKEVKNKNNYLLLAKYSAFNQIGISFHLQYGYVLESFTFLKEINLFLHQLETHYDWLKMNEILKNFCREVSVYKKLDIISSFIMK